MKLKKFLSGIGALLLCSALLFPVPTQAADESEGVTTITTKVPDTHTVLLDIGEHGSVRIDDKTYTSKDKQAEVARLAEQTYTIQPDKGWQVEQVKYGQKEAPEAIKLTDNAFTAPAVNSNDNKLVVHFTKVSAGENNTHKPNGNGNTGVQTGDNSNIAGMGTLLLLSMTAIILLSKRKNLPKKYI